MAYAIVYLDEAHAELLDLPRPVRRNVRRLLNHLAQAPRPDWADPCWGPWEGHWKARVGPGAYRVVYQIEDRAERILVVRVGHRSTVYER